VWWRICTRPTKPAGYDYARKLADDGYVALTFDFRGYGESGGSRQIDRIDRDVTAKDAVTKVMAPELFIGAEDDAGGPAAAVPARMDEFLARNVAGSTS
jgi:predicted alpha/beta hydrolase